MITHGSLEGHGRLVLYIRGVLNMYQKYCTWLELVIVVLQMIN